MTTKTVIEYRIVGRNSGETPFFATQEEAEKRLTAYSRYLQYGHAHTLQSREVTVTAWK